MLSFINGNRKQNEPMKNHIMLYALVIILVISGNCYASDSLTYIVEEIDLKNKQVTIKVDLPFEQASSLAIPPDNSFYKNHGVRLTGVSPAEQGKTRYVVDYNGMNAGQPFPALLPIWQEHVAFLPFWSWLARPVGVSGIAEVVVTDDLGKKARILWPDEVTSDNFNTTFLIYGYRSHAFSIGDRKIEMFSPDTDSMQYLIHDVPIVLRAHFNVFPDTFFKRYYLVFNYGDTMPGTKHGTGTTAQTYHFLLQDLVPECDEDEWELQDLVEREFCTWFMKSSEPEGSYMAKGLTTYLAKRILYDKDVFGIDSWDYFQFQMYKDMLKNPLGRSVSVAEAQTKFMEPDYANLMYNKAALVAFLLDEDSDTLVKFAAAMFKEKVSQGALITLDDYKQYLGTKTEYFEQLMHMGDMVEELRKAGLE